MISKNKNKKETPAERDTHLKSISIDDGVGAHSGTYAGSRRGSRHPRGRCYSTLKTFF